MQLRPNEVGPSQLRLTEDGPLQLRPIEIGPLQLRPTEVGPLQLRLIEVGPLQLRPTEAGPLQLRLTAVCPLQLRLLEVGPLQPRPAEFGPLQLRPTEAGLLQLRLSEVHTAQNRTIQIKLAVRATQPLDVSRCPAAQIKPLHRGAFRIARPSYDFSRLYGALRLLLLGRLLLAHAPLAHAVHRAHDHRVRPVRVRVAKVISPAHTPAAAQAAHVRVVRHLGQREPCANLDGAGAASLPSSPSAGGVTGGLRSSALMRPPCCTRSCKRTSCISDGCVSCVAVPEAGGSTPAVLVVVLPRLRRRVFQTRLSTR